MPTFVFYLLKVILCSAVLFGYYHFFLRNKVYHAYNRFYLLATVFIAMLVPAFNFEYLFTSGAAPATPIKLLQVVTSGDEYLEEIILHSHQNFISLSQASMFIYGIVSLVLLSALIKVLVEILSILKTNSSKHINDVVFVESNAKGTPFSFFNFIFWNQAIDLHSETGQQIFAHELAHVREKHSLDKLFLNIVLIFCWINPIFWLIKKEMNLIHEFIADKKAVADNDASALAAMIITSAYPMHSYLLTNHFFYSPIKRRLQMLAKYNMKKAGYFYRILALPLVLFLVAAFTIKTRDGFERLLNPANKIIVVIDAGHGGTDAGAGSFDGKSFEKNINLAFVKKIKALNKSFNIEIILTRETDIYQSPKEKAAVAAKAGADLFISVHTASEPFATATKSGLEVYVANDNFANSSASKLFASSVIANFKSNYGLPVLPLPRQRKTGTHVLQANIFPSVIIETGYISNLSDLAYLHTEKSKEDFAKNILAAITQYANNIDGRTKPTPLTSFNSPQDTIPSALSLGYYKGESIKAIDVSKDCEIVQLKLGNGKTISMSVNEAKKQQINLPPVVKPASQTVLQADLNKQDRYKVDASERLTITGDKANYYNGAIRPESITISSQNSGVQIKSLSGPGVNPLLIVDGKEITYAEINAILPNSIESVNVLKGEAAAGKYGAQKSINGVLEIKTKNTKPANYNPAVVVVEHRVNSPESKEQVFASLEKEAEFPGGKEAWTKYLRENLNANQPVDEGWSVGVFKVIIKFVVAEDGTISDVSTENFPGSKTAQMCKDFIKNGPKWIPGKQNGIAVKSTKKQPITFVVDKQ